jgi:hypothetical protein
VSDQVGVADPGLAQLADNGGPTETVALQAASPAIGAADLATCQAAPIAGVDQRGERRGTSCDIGAFETSPVAAGDSATVAQDSGFTPIDVLANDAGDAISITSVGTAGTHGQVTVTGGGSGLSYKPDPGYCNTGGSDPDDTFTYTVNGGSTATVSVEVTCTPVTPPPPPGGNPPGGGPGGTPPDHSAPKLDLGPVRPQLTTKKRAAKVVISFSSEPGATFTCAVDGGDPRACSSPFRAKLKAGRGRGKRHTVAIVATDAAGNSSQPQTATIRVVRKRSRGH